MSATSTSRDSVTAARIKTAASTLYSDNQCLLSDIRKAFIQMKEVGAALEKDKQHEMVKDLEDNFVELLEATENYTDFSSALQIVGDIYQPTEELTDFKKLIAVEVAKIKNRAASNLQNNPLLRQFKEAIWNVHHAGQSMPGEEQEDIVVTNMESTILNFICPLTGKPVTELFEPVRSVECRHIYEREAVLNYLVAKNSQELRCPVSACPRLLRKERIVCDPMLLAEIEELRSMKKSAGAEAIEDFTDV